MKKLCVLLTITILAGVCVNLQAQERQLLRAAVPFAFTADNTRLPAGSYTVYLLNPYNTVRLQSADGHNVAILRSIPATRSSGAQQTELVFQRIADQYFLSEVREQGSNIRRDLPLGSHAQELAKNRNFQQVATAVAIPSR
jgi:environmental stress-induced protein Ves